MNSPKCDAMAAQSTAAINMVTAVIKAWDNRLGKLVDTITDALKTQAVTLRESEDRITHVNGMIKNLTEVTRDMQKKGSEYEAQRIRECSELRAEISRLNQLVEKLAEDVKHEQAISEMSMRQNDRLMNILAAMNTQPPAQTVNISEVANRTEK